MADTDLLPSRGVTFEALVDSTGVAINGSSTVAQLASKGMRAACAVDGTGTAITGGGSLAQIAAAGIRAFCAVDQNGVAQDASTADQLRARGIRPRVLLDATGVALNGSAGQAVLASRGLQSFCPVDESGNATTMGAVILISNTNVFDNIAVGATVGTLSVAGGSGTYTFTLPSNPGAHFATAGTNGVNLNTATALTAGSYPVTVQAAGGVPTPISRALSITVSQAPTIPANTAVPVISGTPQVGQTLTTTNGTWTGFPTPAFTYQWKRGVMPISGATSNTYLLIPNDIGTTTTVTVTATNSAGNASATSAGVGPVTGVAPVNTALPTISGGLVVASVLTVTTGTWTGAPAPTYSYQWQRAGVTIAGATSSSYTLVSADVGTMTSVVVTATNSAGSANATAPAVGPISAVGGAGYTLIAQVGSFPYVGADMTVLSDYTLHAQNGAFAFNGFSATLSTTAGAGVYTGPGDISGWGTAYGYWGLRAYNSTKIGAACVDVCSNYSTTSPVNLTTIVIGSNGYADFSGVGFSPIYLQKIYDQAGTQHLTIPASTGRASIVNTQIGGKPAIKFDGGSYYVAASTAAAHPQPLSFAAIAFYAIGGGGSAVVTDGTNVCVPFYYNNTNQVYQFSSTTFNPYPCTDGAYHALISVMQGTNGSGSTMMVDGAITTTGSAIGTAGFSTTNKLTIGGNDAGGEILGVNCCVYEVMIKDGAVASGNQSNLNANMHSIGTGW